MKATIQQCAETLYEATKDKSQGEINDIVSNLAKILAENNQLKLADKIIEKFDTIYNEANGIIYAEITSRENLNSELMWKLNGFLKDKYKAKEVIIKNKIDEKIKGGVIIKIGDEIMDGSIKKRLDDLKETLTL